ncbi:MAG: AAA family ATPase [Bacteroidota bacterium]
MSDSSLGTEVRKKKPKVYTGIDSFADLLLESDVFVDKSLFIQEFLEESGGQVKLITRPRRWGKSMNMDMLKRFLSIEVDAQGVPLPREQCLHHKLFAGGEAIIGPTASSVKQLAPLKLTQQHPDLISGYQGQYPVISIGLKDVFGSSYEEILADIRTQVINLYAEYGFLDPYIQAEEPTLRKVEKRQLDRYFSGETTPDDLKSGLYFLSKLLCKHFGKRVYVLIDEYDTPINNAFIELKDSPEELRKVLRLFQGLFGTTFKSNPYLEKGLVTGILRVAKANLFSSLNNVREYTLFDKHFATSYGFTQEEVDELFSQVPTSTTVEEVKYWYNGYKFGDQVLYNPWSIMCCLETEGVLDTYWIDSGGTQLVDEALLSDDIQKQLQQLIAKEQIDSFITKQISFEDVQSSVGLYSLLLFAGYLNLDAVKPGDNSDIKECKLSIPNHEVRCIYKHRLLEWVRRKLQINSWVYNSLIDMLATGQVAAFGERLQALLHQSTSFHQTGPVRSEVFYNGFMSCLWGSLKLHYTLENERDSGLGRADAMLIPDVGHSDQALIMEYKVGQDPASLEKLAEAGLAQIINRRYSTALQVQTHVKRALQVCLAFCGKEMALQYNQVDL